MDLLSPQNKTRNAERQCQVDGSEAGIIERIGFSCFFQDDFLVFAASASQDFTGFISSGKADQVIFGKTEILTPLLAVSFLLLEGMIFLAVRRNRNHRIIHD